MIETARLQLRPLIPDDAAFILNLLNQPSWLRFIGDKGVHTLDDARDYILNGPMVSYQQHGFGLYLTHLKAGDIPIGLCGLVKRDGLPEVDIGFALLAEHCNQGYAYEAAAATLDHARRVLNLQRILAITLPANRSSVKLLQRLGLKRERSILLKKNEEPLELYSIEFPPAD